MGATQVELLTALFNVEDLLQTPVPYSIYTSQPWCASDLFSENTMAQTNTYSCPMDTPYKPIIVAPGQVLGEIDPAFASCSAELKGFYDPPTALQKATAVAATTPNAPSTTETSPAQTAHATITQPNESTATREATTTEAQESTTGAAGPAIVNTTPAAQPTALSDPAAGQVHSAATVEGQGPAAENDSIVAPAGSNGGNDATAPQDATAVTSQNVGGVIASLMGGDNDPVTSAGTIPSPEPTTPHSGGVVESIFAAELSATGAQDGHSGGLSTADSAKSAAQTGAQTNLPSPGAADVDPALSPTATGYIATFTMDGNTYTARPGEDLTLAHATLTDGGPAITTGGQTVRLVPSGVIVDGQLAAYSDPQHFSDDKPMAVIAIGTERATATSGEPFVVGSHTLSVGGPAATVEGEVVSMADSGVVLDGTTSMFTASTGAGMRTSSDTNSAADPWSTPSIGEQAATGEAHRQSPGAEDLLIIVAIVIALG